jgi:hypothetical protein
MSRSHDPSQRPAAAVFLAAMAPLAFAIAQAGGIVALIPLALLVLPILAIGRVPGVAGLQARGRQPRRRRALAASRPRAPFHRRVSGGLLIAVRLSNRAPPLACSAAA